MLSIRWKTYRVSNYILLVCSAIIFLILVRQFFAFRRTEFDLLFAMFSFVFFSMIVSSLINITIMSKTFPDKTLNNNQNRWHVFSIVLNVLAFAGLFYAFISLMMEIDSSNSEEMVPFLIMLAIVFILLVIVLFTLASQAVLKKYLRSKNDVTVNSMINSIGRDV